MEDCGISHAEVVSPLYFFVGVGSTIYGAKGDFFSYKIPLTIGIRDGNRTVPATSDIGFFFTMILHDLSMICDLGDIEGRPFVAAGRTLSECKVELLVPTSYQKRSKKSPVIIRLNVESVNLMDGRKIDAGFTEWLTLQPKANKRSFDHNPGSDQGGGKLANVDTLQEFDWQPPTPVVQQVISRGRDVDVTDGDFRQYPFGDMNHVKVGSPLPFTFATDTQEGRIRMDLIDAAFQQRIFKVPDNFLPNLKRFAAKDSTVFALVSADYTEVFFLRVSGKEARIYAKKFVVTIDGKTFDEKHALKLRSNFIFKYLEIDPAVQGDKSLRTATATELPSPMQHTLTETIAAPPLNAAAAINSAFQASGFVDAQGERRLVEMIPNFGNDFDVFESMLLLESRNSTSRTSAALAQSIDEFSAEVFQDTDRQLMAEVVTQPNNESDEQQVDVLNELNGLELPFTPVNLPNAQDNEGNEGNAADDFLDLLDVDIPFEFNDPR